MPYPDTEPTVDELQNNPALRRDLCVAFNKKSKEGINKIYEIGKKNGLDESAQRKELAKFFLNNKSNLNLTDVGDYLSGPDDAHKEVLAHFTKEYQGAMKGVEFTQAMRDYIGQMRLPGEGQKIDRIVQAFGNAYVQENPDCGIANGSAAYMAAYAGMMFATSAHNPGVRKEDKITLEGAKAMLRGGNDKQDFSPEFVKGLYEGMSSKPLDVTFIETEPRLELDSAQLKNDRLFKALDKELGKKNSDITKQLGIEGAKTEVDAKKPFFGFLTGYKSTITITDENGNQAKVEISKPGFFSRSNPTVTVKPVGDGEGRLELASQVAARFEATATPKASYAYQREDMTKFVSQHKQGKEVGLKVEEVQLKQSQSVEGERVKLSRQGYRGEQNLDKEVVRKKEKVMDELSSTLAKRKEKVVDGPGSEQSVGKAIGYKKEEPKAGVKEGQGKGVGSGF